MPTSIRPTLPLLLALLALSSCGAPGVRAPAVTVAPSLRVASLSGDTTDLGAALASGRSVMLVFWQTWCASCLAEAPELAAAAREHGDEWTFLGVVPGPDELVDDGEVERVAAAHGLPYPQYRDRDASWSRTFGVTGTPTLIALRPDGSEGWRGHRPPADWTALHHELHAER